MIERFLKIVPWLLGILAIINVAILDLIVVNKKLIAPSLPPIVPLIQKEALSPTPALTKLVNDANCPQACLQEIQQSVKEEVASIPPTTKTQTIVTKTNPTPQVSVAYVPIDGSGSTSSMTWADIPGTDFYFDLADYSKAKSVRWEVSLQSYLSGNPAYVRLYDVTNKRAVDGSEHSTHSSDYQYVRSGDLTIWRGNNLYRIQAKGSSGNTVNFTSPRLRIILE